ncbi:hypothetical protein PTKU46_86450 [Paraburkholderia terrae]
MGDHRVQILLHCSAGGGLSGYVAAPPYGYNDPAYGPGYYAPGPTIGVGVGGGSVGGGVGVGVGVGF